MNKPIDARGLSCPQPVLLALDQIKKQQDGVIEVLVDTETAKENISRAARVEGWDLKDISENDEGFKLVFEKGK